jgi:hypothetical protein
MKLVHRGAKTRTLRLSVHMTMPAEGENVTNLEEDSRVEAALIQRVLDLHPTRVTIDELTRDLCGEDADFGARDAIERAVRELNGAGLLHRGADDLLTPTRAAVHLNDLLGT